MTGGGGRGRPVAEINVTPLVDVMLVLLIIFMVTAPMLNNSGIDVDLPKEQAPPLDSVDDQLVLGIDKDLKFYLNDTETPREELPAKLKAIAEANPDAPIFLKADREVPYGEVAWVLSAAKKAGMPRLGFVFDPGAK
jgi:biopolymer transport protein TolR